MRKVLSTFRSRNHTALYVVVRDGVQFTMEVWRVNPNVTEPWDHCRTFPFTPDPNIRIRSTSEVEASRRAFMLADALSRMSAAEAIRQFDHVKQFGEIR